MDEDNFQRNISAVDDLVSSHANKVYTGNSKVFVVGGEKLYQDTVDGASVVLLTRIFENVPCRAYLRIPKNFMKAFRSKYYCENGVAYVLESFVTMQVIKE